MGELTDRTQPDRNDGVVNAVDETVPNLATWMSDMLIILICFIAPWLAMFMRGHFIQGIMCIILHITLIGWIPATIWALVVCRREGDF